MDKEQKEIPKVKYSDAELAYRSSLIQELCYMRDQRDQPHPELDGMTYVEYWENNRKKDLSYIPPKKNKQDVRVVTGTTREKDSTLLATLLNLNFEPDVTAYDTDDMIVAELGDNMSDMVKKSRELENWDKKRPIIYREMISQGDVFVQEIWVEDFRKIPLTELEWDPNKDGISEFSFSERLQEVYSGCSARMINGKKVYLGSMKVEYVEDQHKVAVMNVYPRSIAEAKYKNWERWENVPRSIETTELFTADGNTYKEWNLTNLSTKGDWVAEIFIYDPKANRLMIMLNGVMMLPINYPLTAVCPTGEIPMTQGKLEPISDFAYSKSQPSKTKVEQAILDETTTLMTEAMRQTRKPPMGSTSKKVYGSNIFNAGRVTYDMQKEALFPLLPPGTQQINASEFSFYKLIKEQINEKTTNEVYSGGEVSGNPTATQINEQKQAQVLKLVMPIDSCINLERRLTWNRIENICQNWTKPISSEIDATREGAEEEFRKFNVNTALENGQKGTKMFRLTKQGFPDVEEQEAEEEKLSKENGKPVRITYMNPEVMRSIKYKWFILINPTPKSNDKLSQLLFVQNIRVAAEMFGIESLNLDYLKQRYAILINEDYSKMFKKEDILAMIQNGIAPDGSKTGDKSRKMNPGDHPLRPEELEAVR